eukprot:1157432-Pelagomonas_calceolata.AAC.3
MESWHWQHGADGGSTCCAMAWASGSDWGGAEPDRETLAARYQLLRLWDIRHGQDQHHQGPLPLQQPHQPGLAGTVYNLWGATMPILRWATPASPDTCSARCSPSCTALNASATRDTQEWCATAPPNLWWKSQVSVRARFLKWEGSCR